MQRDIRKWLMKAHDESTSKASKSEGPHAVNGEKEPSVSASKREISATECQSSSGRRKTSKYFVSDNQLINVEKQIEQLPINKTPKKSEDKLVKTPPSKRILIDDDDDDDDNESDSIKSKKKKIIVDDATNKKLKTSHERGRSKKFIVHDESDEEDKDAMSSLLSSGSGRGVGGRGALGSSASGRGRGGRHGGFMGYGERKDPPHKGEKQVPEGASDCLAGLTFVISGTLDSLEREEAEDLIKRHGGRVTGSVSKKTSYLLCDEDIEGRKSSKAKELGTSFLTEDGLFDVIRSSNKTVKRDVPMDAVKKEATCLKKSVPKPEVKKSNSVTANEGRTNLNSDLFYSTKQKDQTVKHYGMAWTEKYRPKIPNEIIGNQSLVNQLHNWLKDWDEQFLDVGKKKKQSVSSLKKALLLSGTPGIGKTTSVKLVSQMLGFQAIEVNASDSRGKADAKIFKGIGGSNANCIKELISNEALGTNMDRSKHQKTVLIMDEVDGMSAGDRGGVADLIASIKISKVPIICICNDRYSQKLKSLVNYCLLLSFRKPTKQQMAKRLMQIANAEGLKVNEIALEELAERVNGDVRLALNQLQYMALSQEIIKYDDVRQRLLSSSKDEDISPFTAVDKLFGFNGGKLRMDERIDLSMSDPDLVPLLVQENYINYRPSSVTKDESGLKRMNIISSSANSIADGDLINVQIRRYRQWQLSPSASLVSCIIPAAFLHGQRETLEPGERNFNRFGGWLGKNSTMGKNLRLLHDLHVHFLASREFFSGRDALRFDYFNLVLKHLTDPLRLLPKDEAVEKVVKFMNFYSISQEDMNTIVELSKFEKHGSPLDGISSTVKAALTRAYKEASRSRMARAADLVTLPWVKKTPKKVASIAPETARDGLEETNDDDDDDASAENERNSSDLDQDISSEEKLHSELKSLNSKGIQVEMQFKKSKENSNTKAPLRGGKGKGGAKRGSTPNDSSEKTRTKRKKG